MLERVLGVGLINAAAMRVRGGPVTPAMYPRRPELRTTCTLSHETYACSEAVVQLSKRVANASDLAWRPYDCPPLPEPGKPEVERCLAGRCQNLLNLASSHCAALHLRLKAELLALCVQRSSAVLGCRAPA